MQSAANTTGRLLRISALVAAFCCCFCCCADASDVYIDYGEWNAWGFCTEQCVQYRRRSCVSKGFLWPCRNVFERQNCFTDSCQRKPAIEANLSALDCGRRRNLPPVLRIFGGKESQPHSWPWHVSLVRNRYSHDQFCGGTLVHPQFVLTARHCVATNYRYTRHVYAVVGDHDTRLKQPNERAYRVVKIRTHPGIRTGNLEYDVALLKLEEPVALSDHVRLACLPRPGDRVSASPVNTMCTAIGFGRQGRSGREPMSQILREANLYLTDHDQCDREYQLTNVHINPHSHVCAAAAGRDTCSGDSGGGLFCANQPDPSSRGVLQERWYLFGITSFGHPRGCGYHSGVFQRTSILYDWVQNSINADLRDRRL